MSDNLVVITCHSVFWLDGIVDRLNFALLNLSFLPDYPSMNTMRCSLQNAESD